LSHFANLTRNKLGFGAESAGYKTGPLSGIALLRRRATIVTNIANAEAFEASCIILGLDEIVRVHVKLVVAIIVMATVHSRLLVYGFWIFISRCSMSFFCQCKIGHMNNLMCSYSIGAPQRQHKHSSIIFQNRLNFVRYQCNDGLLYQDS
jgi:hypothetical protein